MVQILLSPLDPIPAWPKSSWHKSCSAQFLFGPNPVRIPCSSPQPITETCRFMINIYRIGIKMNMLRSVIPRTLQYNKLKFTLNFIFYFLKSRTVDMLVVYNEWIMRFFLWLKKMESCGNDFSEKENMVVDRRSGAGS